MVIGRTIVENDLERDEIRKLAWMLPLHNILQKIRRCQLFLLMKSSLHTCACAPRVGSVNGN